MYLAANNFLFPNFTLVVEVVIFLVLLALLRKYVYPVIDAMLAERQRRIGDAIKEAERLREQMERSHRELEAQMAEARAQAQSLLDQAQIIGEQVREEIRQRGQQEADMMLKRARADLEMERQKAVDGLRQHMADLVVAATGRILKEEIDADRHARLIDEALDQVDLRA